MVKTRFNPSLNGALHLGHLLTLLVNEYTAHSVGGEFYVRFDDTSYVSTKSGRMQQVMDLQMYDIGWLGIKVDGWYKQSEALQEIRWNKLGFIVPKEDDSLGYVLPISVRFGAKFIYYPYAPRQTAERVVMDRALGITHLIRGEDFVTEYSYYSYICQMCNFPVPEFWFLPRLSSWEGDISKTNGGYTLAEYQKKGYSPEEVMDLMARSCLITPLNGWSLYNVKPNPILMP